MSTAHSRWRFNGAELVQLGPTKQLPLLVADSFLLRDGAVVAPELHRDRFIKDAARQGLVNSPEPFLDAANDLLPTVGEWFPRIDLTERGELELLLRPAPLLGREIVVWSCTTDPRVTPGIKGPDIPALQSLREVGHEQGADEAILVTPEGDVLDGSTTCIVWWSDEQLLLPALTEFRVDSVTVRVMREIALELGIPVHTASPTLSALQGSEVWAVNALHGIRAVKTWLTGPDVLTNDERLDAWRRHYADRFSLITSAH